MKVQLVVVQGKPEGMVIPLANARYKIGRGEGCQLRPNSDLVSREHAEFVMGADSVLVQDLGSRNGTEVNGKRLAPNQPQTLKSGDLIKVGTLTFAIAIEGVPATKAASTLVGGGGTRKPSLDDVSGDEIDAWLVSDESRPTPDRPSGVYGGDTITLATYNGQEKSKAAPEPVKAVATPAPAARPAPPVPKPAPVPAPAVVPAPAAVAPAPIAQPVLTPAVSVPPPAPALTPAPPVVQAVEPTPVPVPVPPVAAAPKPAPVVEEPMMNPLFNFVPDPMDEAQPEAEFQSFDETPEDDGIEDLSALQAADSADEDAGSNIPDEYVDESNPFFVKKKPAEAPVTDKAGLSGDSSSAAGDILRKLLDRRRASK